MASAGYLNVPDLVTASDAYARRFAGRAGGYLLKVQSDTIESLISENQTLDGVQVLDHGGGHGQLADLFKRIGMKRTYSASSAAIVPAKCDSDQAIIGAMDSLDCSDQSFDYVVSVRLVAHVESVEKLVAEMCRVARNAVIVDYPSTSGFNALSRWFFRIKQRIEGDTRPYTSISDRQLRAVFARCGFEHTRTVRQFLIPMGIHRFLGGGALLEKFEDAARRIGLTYLLGNPSVSRFDRIAADA